MYENLKDQFEYTWSRKELVSGKDCPSSYKFHRQKAMLSQNFQPFCCHSFTATKWVLPGQRGWLKQFAWRLLFSCWSWQARFWLITEWAVSFLGTCKLDRAWGMIEASDFWSHIWISCTHMWCICTGLPRGLWRPWTNINVGHIGEGVWGHTPRKFWDITCSEVCSGGFWGSMPLYAITVSVSSLGSLQTGLNYWTEPLG